MYKTLTLLASIVIASHLTAGNGDSLLLVWDKTKHLAYETRRSEILKIVEWANADHDLKTQANALRRLGTLEKSVGHLDAAINYYIHAVHIAESIHYPTSMASSLHQVATVYKQLNNPRQATRYFQMAFDTYASIPDERGMSNAFVNLADIFFNVHKIDSAQTFCLQSLAYMRRWGDTSTVGYNYDLLSCIALQKNDPEKALQYANVALGLLRQDNDPAGLVPALQHVGKIYAQRNKQDSALKYLNTAYGEAAAHGYTGALFEITQALADTYEELGLKDSLIHYLNLRQTYADSLGNEARLRVTQEMLTRFDTEKKEMELRTQLKLTENSQLLNIALAIVVILLLVMILVLIRNANQRKKIALRESELSSANAMLKGQDNERARIARELHDRVGSMISAVKLHFSSVEERMSEIVETQQRSNKKIVELLDETYEEVRRISHNLDPGRVSRVGLRIAILELVREIEATNTLKVLFIDNDLDPALYKDVENDLYDITRELLVNTMKHALAREVSIQLSRNNGNIVYSYEDDGKGFSKEQLQDSYGTGYKNIEARVKKMNGKWHLETSPGNGLNLIIELPISAHTHHHS